MTIEQKKTYLRKAYRLDRLVQSHAAELERLRSTLGSLGSSLDGQPRTPRYDSSTGEINRLIQVIDLEQQLKDEIAAMGARWKEIHNTIEAVEDKDERLVLRYRYIQGLDWDYIAVELNYSRRQVIRIHGEALEHLRPPEK